MESDYHRKTGRTAFPSVSHPECNILHQMMPRGNRPHNQSRLAVQSSCWRITSENRSGELVRSASDQCVSPARHLHKIVGLKKPLWIYSDTAGAGKLLIEEHPSESCQFQMLLVECHSQRHMIAGAASSWSTVFRSCDNG